MTRNASNNIVTLSRVIQICLLLVVVFIVVSVISLLVGPSHVGIAYLLKGLLSPIHSGDIGPVSTEKTILFSIRLPRIIFAGIVGASLAAAGVVFQGIFRNPLADPYILGISGGSAVGAIIGIIVGAGVVPLGIPGLAVAGALLTIALVYGIARTNRELHSNTILLAGIIVNAFFSAVIMFLISTASSTELHSAIFWTMGDLSIVEWSEVALTGFFLTVSFIVMYVYSRHMNLIISGEETAMQLGVNVEQTKKVLLLTASLVTGVAVSFSGIIGFVGLIIPHMMRMLLGPDHRLLLPASALFGGTFLVVADTIARTVTAPAELPVGVITAMCGAPYFIYLLRKGAV